MIPTEMEGDDNILSLPEFRVLASSTCLLLLAGRRMLTSAPGPGIIVPKPHKNRCLLLGRGRGLPSAKTFSWGRCEVLHGIRDYGILLSFRRSCGTPSGTRSRSQFGSFLWPMLTAVRAHDSIVRLASPLPPALISIRQALGTP